MIYQLIKSENLGHQPETTKTTSADLSFQNILTPETPPKSDTDF